MTHTYDSILETASRLEPPHKTGHLNVDWLVAGRLAIGRDADNRHLLVLAGKSIQTTRDSIQRAMMHGSWNTEAGLSIDGTLPRLHAGEQFLLAATTIAATTTPPFPSASHSSRLATTMIPPPSSSGWTL